MCDLFRHQPGFTVKGIRMNSYLEEVKATALAEAQKTYMVKVYGWMVGGLMATGLVGGFVASDASMIQSMLDYFWFFIIAEFALVFALSAFIHKMSVPVAILSFIGYSVLNGITLSAVLLAYDEAAVMNAFLTTSGTFAAMSVYGIVTKKDLSSWGSFFFMGLIGIIIASIVNIFLASSALSFAISLIGVFDFIGLTAYHTQKIKESAGVELQGSDMAMKGAILGALTLYLDFINLFLFILRLFGGSNDD